MGSPVPGVVPVVTLTAGAGAGGGQCTTLTTHWRLAPPWPPHRHHSVCPHPRWGPEHGDHADHRVTRDT